MPTLVDELESRAVEHHMESVVALDDAREAPTLVGKYQKLREVREELDALTGLIDALLALMRDAYGPQLCEGTHPEEVEADRRAKGGRMRS